MKNVLVIGANGQVGQHIVKKLQVDGRYNPIAFVRKQEQVHIFEETGIQSRLGDLEDIIFSTGSGKHC